MEVTVRGFDDTSYVIEVGEDDTTETMRQKVASAAGLAEDSFHMGFGGKDEGEDITQLSAGDTIVLTKSMKYEAVAALHALGETDLTLERLKKVEDPEVACLLLQAEVATVIPKYFLSERSLTRLDLSAVSFVTQIGDAFLEYCGSLTSIDLSGLSNVTRIGRCFLARCKALTSLDLTPLNKVTVIEIGFLSGCETLTNLDLTPCNNVTKIESCFLFGCKSLTTLDLTPLNNVTKIEIHFLSGCISLTTLDLSPLNKVEDVGSYFAAKCTSLTSIYLSGCSSAVSNKVKKSEKLSKLVVEERP